MARDFDFFQAINALSKTKSIPQYNKKVKELTKHALLKYNAFYPYRLALELDRKDRSIEALENHIIRLAKTHASNQRYLVIAAVNLNQANIPKLQGAVVETGNANLIADFCCFVSSANKELLENIVLELKIPRASYIFLRFYKNCQLDKHKDILIKSKKSKYIYACAKITKSIKELRWLEDLIISNKSHYYVRLMATIENADIDKLEKRILETKNFLEIKKMYNLTKSPSLAKYVLLM